MNGFVVNIEEETLNNNNFRKVLYTAKNSQLVLMTLEPGDDIGEEVHEEHDQFIRIEQGSGKAVLNMEEHEIKDDYAVLIPAGTRHNIVNTGDSKMKLYTLYSPPEHKDGTVHQSKADAMDSHEHFDGQTTE